MASHCDFVAALVRRPSAAVTEGLRGGSGPDPDPELFARQHETYVRALEDLGLAVVILPEDARFPDSVFVEDTALCFPTFAVICRPGAASRAGEEDSIRDALSTWYSDIEQLPRGHVDGGDVLWTGREVIVGVSSRTDSEGAQALVDLLEQRGMRARTAPTPDGVLHFKSDAASLDEHTILATARLAESGVFSDYTVVTVPAGEEAAANAVRIGDTVMLPSGYPATHQLLIDSGYSVTAVDNSEPAAIDGGLSCMSLRIPAS